MEGIWINVEYPEHSNLLLYLFLNRKVDRVLFIQFKKVRKHVREKRRRTDLLKISEGSFCPPVQTS